MIKRNVLFLGFGLFFLMNDTIRASERPSWPDLQHYKAMFHTPLRWLVDAIPSLFTTQLRKPTPTEIGCAVGVGGLVIGGGCWLKWHRDNTSEGPALGKKGKNINIENEAKESDNLLIVVLKNEQEKINTALANTATNALNALHKDNTNTSEEIEAKLTEAKARLRKNNIELEKVRAERQDAQNKLDKQIKSMDENLKTSSEDLGEMTAKLTTIDTEQTQAEIVTSTLMQTQMAQMISSHFGQKLRNGAEKQWNVINIAKNSYTKKDGTQGARNFRFMVDGNHSLMGITTIKNGIERTYTADTHPKLFEKLNSTLCSDLDPTLKNAADRIIVNAWNDETKRKKLVSDIKNPETCRKSNGNLKTPNCHVRLSAKNTHPNYKLFFKDRPWNVIQIQKFHIYSHSEWGYSHLGDDDLSAVSRYLETRWKDKYPTEM
jgi:hypothetical protein